MSKLLKYYKILGVEDGAGMSDVASSYKRLCRVYHPDISRDPGSEEMMKRINLAYSILRENLGRKAASPAASQRREQAQNAQSVSEWEAFSTLSGYFDAILGGDYERAYGLLSAYDKRFVTLESFCRWRKSVARLFLMRGFTIEGSARGAAVTLGGGKALPARKFHVSIVEKNIETGQTGPGELTKLTVREDGAWRVFLGYKDLREIARVFEELFEEKRKSEIVKSWEAYYDDMCPGLGLLSRRGLEKEVGRELYRLRRYGGELTVAGLCVVSRGGAHEGEAEELMRGAARAVMRAIRETDIAGYIGGGGFVVLFTHLGRESAADITKRLAERVRQELVVETGREIEVLYKCEQPKAAERDICKLFDRLCKNR